MLIDKYGVKWNNEREKAGLKPISGLFECVDAASRKSNEYFAKYMIKDVKINDSCVFYSVYDLIRNDSLLFEIENVYGRKLVHTVDGTFREEMRLIYYFYDCIYDEKIHKKGWECMLVNSNENEIDLPISREKADSIFTSWNPR